MTLIWIFAALSLVSALTYGFHFVHHSPSMTRKLCKTAAVGSLAMISVLSGAPVLLTLALVLGTIGDAFLAWDGERNFLLGLLAFLLGHLTYIPLLYGLGGGFEQIVADPLRPLACIVLAVVALRIVQQLLPHLGKMTVPVLVYAAVIIAMGFTAWTLPFEWPLGLAILGALLFITSDAVLGFELFVVKDRHLRKNWPATLLWVLYWGGQSLIVLAILTA